MAEVTFDERTLDKVKNRLGIYNKTKLVTQAPGFVEELRANIMKTIEVAFREYAKKHTGCTPKLENEEWRRFERILKKKL